MRKVQCEECGRRYDFDIDDFCPKCGAFNQPPRSMRIGMDGSVVRVDGINEHNHRGSFVHRELHAEERERRRVGLERGTSRGGAAAPRSARPVKQSTYERERGKFKFPLIGWIILVIIGLNFFSSFLRIFLW